MARDYVRCCDANKGEDGDNIYLDYDDNAFKQSGIYDAPIYYCPWCGILLDINLEMSPAWEE